VLRFILLGVLLLLVARAFWKVVDSVMEAAGGAPRSARGGRTQAPSVRLVRDPVCGTHVPTTSALSLTLHGTTHYFCSQKCRDEFRRRS
jgi:YHS domain-containing protein